MLVIRFLSFLVAFTNLVNGQSIPVVQPEVVSSVQPSGKEQGTVQTFCTEQNERYTSCSSSNCFEQTCADLVAPTTEFKQCRKDCRSGCQCKPAYYRNLERKCVSELTCLMCGQGEEWSQGPEKKCDNFMPAIESTPNKSKTDSITNTWGCYCSNDTYRTRDGLCVSIDTCKTCGVNEFFETCGSSSCWENKCKDATIPRRVRDSKMCTQDCKEGCKCHPGYYRDNRNGSCISAIDCIAEKKKRQKKRWPGSSFNGGFEIP